MQLAAHQSNVGGVFKEVGREGGIIGEMQAGKTYKVLKREALNEANKSKTLSN